MPGPKSSMQQLCLEHFVRMAEELARAKSSTSIVEELERRCRRQRRRWRRGAGW